MEIERGRCSRGPNRHPPSCPSGQRVRADVLQKLRSSCIHATGIAVQACRRKQSFLGPWLGPITKYRDMPSLFSKWQQQYDAKQYSTRDVCAGAVGGAHQRTYRIPVGFLPIPAKDGELLSQQPRDKLHLLRPVANRCNCNAVSSSQDAGSSSTPCGSDSFPRVEETMQLLFLSHPTSETPRLSRLAKARQKSLKRARKGTGVYTLSECCIRSFRSLGKSWASASRPPSVSAMASSLTAHAPQPSRGLHRRPVGPPLSAARLALLYATKRLSTAASRLLVEKADCRGRNPGNSACRSTVSDAGPGHRKQSPNILQVSRKGRFTSGVPWQVALHIENRRPCRSRSCTQNDIDGEAQACELLCNAGQFSC